MGPGAHPQCHHLTVCVVLQVGPGENAAPPPPRPPLTQTWSPLLPGPSPQVFCRRLPLQVQPAGPLEICVPERCGLKPTPGLRIFATALEAPDCAPRGICCCLDAHSTSVSVSQLYNEAGNVTHNAPTTSLVHCQRRRRTAPLHGSAPHTWMIMSQEAVTDPTANRQRPTRRPKCAIACTSMNAVGKRCCWLQSELKTRSRCS